ncbi:SIS domain-containing protein [Mesorhizobium sp. KR1-2]|uniref:SIS domain-containing protein n=1 Tax=Mesorhizobium sp. KR1-2 TaxID=3156609 RepID=UPI0032B43A84
MHAQPDRDHSHASAPMLADIRRQAATLGEVHARREAIGTFAEINLRPGKAGRTHIFGSGDGWFAARAALTGTQQGQAHSGLDFVLNVAPTLTADDRAVAISMSGNVDRTLEGAQIAQARGARLSVLTNGQGGRLGALGDALHSLDIPDIAPFLCGTSSYTATLATLQLAFASLDPRSRFPAALGALLTALPGFIEEADRFARSVAERAGSAFPGARFLGVGASVATADYGAAKFVEVTKIPAWSDDIEEFAHRQYWGMQTSEIVVLLPLDEGSARYADATADALSDLGILTIALEPQGAGVPSASARLALPGDGRTVGITQAIALQLLAYHLGFASGTDPNRREHLKNDQARFSVSRKLTRRSLLGTGQ